MRCGWWLCVLLVLAGCGAESEGPSAPVGAGEGRDEVGLGLIDGEQQQKADGSWGEATVCKEFAQVEPLKAPMIVVSLDGLTLHLFDQEGDYDRVFRVGVGAKEEGVSLTPSSASAPGGVFWARADKPVADDSAEKSVWSWNMRCRIWWTNPENNEQLPVFGGLPWIRLEGPPTLGYGIHGPIDNFTLPSGGTLRRGYVSHGCMRMAPEELVEVWGRIQGHRVPVRIQQAPERRADGSPVEVAEPWILSPCADDAGCGFAGGFCKKNPYSERGYCTRACERSCPDKAGYPETFCVADPEDASQGICTIKDVAWAGCHQDHFVSRAGVGRFGDASRVADVCLPGTQGWVGDRCFEDGECETGLCTPLAGGPGGLCTQPCERFCPDKEGDYASTFCVEAPGSVPEEGGICVARCVSNDDCPAQTSCRPYGRFGEAENVSAACVPL